MNSVSSPHLRWITLGIVSVFLYLASVPLCDFLSDHSRQMLSSSQIENARAVKQFEQWKEDSLAAKTLAKSLSNEEITRLLESGSPKAMTSHLEPLAAASRLSNFSYTLSPASPWDGMPDFPGIEGIVKSVLTIETDAPHDADIFAFLGHLSSLQGKFKLTELHILPISDKPDQPLSDLNLHARATLEWLANRPAEMETP